MNILICLAAYDTIFELLAFLMYALPLHSSYYQVTKRPGDQVTKGPRDQKSPSLLNFSSQEQLFPLLLPLLLPLIHISLTGSV